MKDVKVVQNGTALEAGVVFFSDGSISCRANRDEFEASAEEYRKSGEPPFDDDAELYKELL